jgi:DNA-binding response OmpR family regulator
MDKSILIVDDEFEFHDLLRFRLQDCGYKILHASNGTQGLNQARQHLPDVILLDLLLPDLDGLTLCEILRRQLSTRAVPVIMISALSAEVNCHAAKHAGACAYFTKPLDFAALKAKLAAVIAAPAAHLGTEDAGN